MEEFPYHDYTSGWTSSKPVPLNPKVLKKPVKENSPARNSSPMSQARLKDLCAEDKAKVGELVKRVALEKNQKEELQNKATQDLKEKEKELLKAKKINKKLQKEAEEIRQQFEKSKELLNTYKQMGVSQVSPVVTPQVASTSQQSWVPPA